MGRWIVLTLVLASLSARAVVIRDDVPDARYRVPVSALPALVDLPHEGHGVLIAPRWVVTAAHTTQWHPITAVMLGGECLAVEQVIVHPGYRKLPDELAAGDAGGAMAFLADSDDIALIRLAKPVTGIRPIPLYADNDELRRRVLIFGKGATGNGRVGQEAGPNRTVLRRAENVISAVESRWLVYTFDARSGALPLEGTLGNGDSGGPLLLKAHGRLELAGLSSWKFVQGDVAKFQPGHYGQRSYQVRISHYLPWIRGVMETTNNPITYRRAKEKRS